MGSDRVECGSNSIENASSGDSNNVDSLEVVSSAGDATRELQGAAEILTRVELDLACTSEKLVNLDILVMHVSSRENDFEAFGSEEEGEAEGLVQRAVEFDILYGFLYSQVGEVECFLSDLDSEITSSRELISSFKQLGNVLRKLEEKFQDCEDSLKWSLEHVTSIKAQSDYFRRILLASSRDENWVDNKLCGLGNNNTSDLNAKIKMQTAEQQREILRMLEKSLAREMDLEKNLSDSKQTEEDLKFRLQQEVYCMEEEAEEMWERMFEAENSAEILSGISKELFGRLQTAQLSINGSNQREMELRSELQALGEQLKEKDCALGVSETSRTELVEKVQMLEQINKDLESKANEAEERANFFESECKPLRESNMDLNNNMSCMKSSIADATETIEQLKRQLIGTELELLHARATAEATLENKIMSECTIKDMENLIQDLKSRVVKAESQTEGAEEKCIVLSESNTYLVEEASSLRRKIDHLETSLHRADEAKKETAKDIRMRAKLITDLVVQLALERERLCKQISSLTKQKKVAAKYSQRKKEPSASVNGSHDEAKEVEHAEKGSSNGVSSKESNEETMGSSATSDETGNEHRESSTAEIRTLDADATTELNTVRNIDARQLKFKSVITVVVLVLVISAFAALLFHQSGVQT